MTDLFTDFVNDVLKREGGFVDRPDDSGGPTNHGITQTVARRFGFKGHMKDLSIPLAIEIYHSLIWAGLSLDLIAKLSPSIALELADTAVNQGVSRAGEFFQRLLNVLNDKGNLYPDIKVDGSIGPATIAAFRSFWRIRAGKDGEVVLMRGLNALQGAFYIELAERRVKDEAFVFGWLLNRVI